MLRRFFFFQKQSQKNQRELKAFIIINELKNEDTESVKTNTKKLDICKKLRTMDAGSYKKTFVVHVSWRVCGHVGERLMALFLYIHLFFL